MDTILIMSDIEIKFRKNKKGNTIIFYEIPSINHACGISCKDNNFTYTLDEIKKEIIKKGFIPVIKGEIKWQDYFMKRDLE